MSDKTIDYYKNYSSSDNSVDSIFSEVSDNNNIDQQSNTSFASPSTWRSRQSYKGILPNKTKALIAASLISPEGEKTLARILKSDRVEYGIIGDKHNKAVHSLKQRVKIRVFVLLTV
jgi:hypothetical protein